MRLRHFLLLATTLAGTAGCPTREKYDQVPAVRITAPMGTVYTNGPVTITVAPDPDLDLPIVLRLDGTTVLKTLESPVYSFVWDTTSAPEGPHTIVAEIALSNGTARSDALTIVVDRQSPTVAILSPSPGATDVVLRSPIQVAFSEAVVLPQSAGAALSLSAGGTNLATTTKLESTGRVATITIDDLTSVPLPTTITGSVAPTITDLAGNALVPPTNWSWTVPDFIKMDLTNHTYPQVAVGSDLRPVVAYSVILATQEVDDFQLHASKHDGTKWNELGPPSSNLKSGARRFSVAVDAQDRPFVCWTELAPSGNQEIHVASWSGGAWDTSRPTIPLSSPSASIIGAPVLRMDSNGRPVVLRQESVSSTLYQLLLVRWDGTAWTSWFDGIGIDGYTSMDLVLGENPIVSWILGTGHLSIGSGTGWTPAPTPSGMDQPFVALDSAKHPMVVTGGSGSFVVQRLVNDSWQLMPAATVPPQASYPRIAADPAGLPILAWYDAQTKGVGMARWTGQRWDTRAFAFGTNAFDDPPQLIVDRQGSAWIGWRAYADLQRFTLWMSNY
jgi:hypothetical protein